MTEQEARRWAKDHVPRETFDRLIQYAELVIGEAAHQNLISASTITEIWARHIVDSAQLSGLVGPHVESWIDLGAGAGFPGIVIALVRPALHVRLVEPRRKRADFLSSAIEALGLSATVEVIAQKVESLEPRSVDVISARAFAPLDRLLPLGAKFARPETCWILPKGRGAASELEAVQRSWQGDFRVVPSLTDPQAAIIVAQAVQPRRKGPNGR